MTPMIVRYILLHVRAQYLFETVKISPLLLQQNNSGLINVTTVYFHCCVKVNLLLKVLLN